MILKEGNLEIMPSPSGPGRVDIVIQRSRRTRTIETFDSPDIASNECQAALKADYIMFALGLLTAVALISNSQRDLQIFTQNIHPLGDYARSILINAGGLLFDFGVCSAGITAYRENLRKHRLINRYRQSGTPTRLAIR